MFLSEKNKNKKTKSSLSFALFEIKQLKSFQTQNFSRSKSIISQQLRRLITNFFQNQ